MLTPPKYRILCIEDDARLRRLVCEDLEDAGYEVLTADSAVAGCEMFFAHAPALVVCDVRMPGMSGFDFYERLQMLDKRIFGAVFIFLTALSDRGNELRGRRLGADDYIIKPVDYEILREVVRLRMNGHISHPVPGRLQSGVSADLLAWFKAPAEPPPAGLAADLHQHFKSACAAPGALTDLPIETQFLSAIVDIMPIAILILDKNGEIHYINESAAAVMGQDRDAMIGQRACDNLVDFINQHIDVAKGSIGYLSAQRLKLRAGGDALPVIARLIPGDSSDMPARVTVLLPSLPSLQPGFGDLLFALFNLTPAERFLATEISAGVNLTDFATTRGVGVETVRSQLKSVFQKMGVARQTDMVRAVLTLQMAIGCVTP